MSGLLLGPTVLGARLALDPGRVPADLDAVRRRAEGVKAGFSEVGREAQALGGSLRGLAGQVAALAGVGGGLGLGAAVQQAASFQESMAKVSTLLPPGESAMKRYGDSVKSMSLKFGQSAEIISDGLFEALSASVPGSRAKDFLDVAGKVAVGGFTDMKTAVGGLTNVINAYGLTVSDATRVANDMNAANVLGKTTVEELSAQIGQVAPIARVAGLTVEDMFSAIGAGTKVGLTTSVVVTSLRQALAGLAKPSVEAQKLAAELGLRFDEGAIKAKCTVPAQSRHFSAGKSAGTTEKN